MTRSKMKTVTRGQPSLETILTSAPVEGDVHSDWLLGLFPSRFEAKNMERYHKYLHYHLVLHCNTLSWSSTVYQLNFET